MVAAAMLLTVLASGCAAPVDTRDVRFTMVNGTACRIGRLIQIPLRVEGGRLMIPATLQGQPVQFMLDTGADNASLTADAAERLHLERYSLPRVRSFGLNGEATASAAIVHDLEIGGFRFGETQMLVVPGHLTDEGPAPLVGLLGAPFLSAFDIELDFEAGQVNFYGDKHCHDGFLPPGVAWSEVPVTMSSGHRIFTTAMIDGHAMQAMVDTGASTLIYKRAASGLDLSDAALAGDRSFDLRGAEGRAAPARLHRFPSLEIGDFRLAPYPAAVVLTGLPSPASGGAPMLVGIDALSHFRVWLAYPSQRMFLAPRVRTGAPPQ